ncbi:C40 family peptidase [Mycobacterium sp. URHB0044]|uniref:C40 family peptidase n=1 Tax=Mycobacterium sp. URHB0044 TaxID=1380386 RepID=UPI00048E2891|nr:C40 family peptidase [Mycobacterium sp. URHB0044]
MPSSLVSVLAAPIRELQALVGPGWAGSTDGDPAVVFAGVRDALADVSANGRRAWDQAGAEWTGAGADAAAEFSHATVAAVDALALRADHMGAATARAADAVARARQQLHAIVEEFEARAEALEGDLESPGMAARLIEEARRALDEAIAVVDELRAELDAQAVEVTAGPPSAPSASPAPTIPAAAVPSWSGGSGSGASSQGPGLGNSVLGSSGLGSSGLGSTDFDRGDGGAARPSADPGVFGSGEEVTLPDGSTATAPNAVAASAVRHALTQLGVPYVWGGTTPGVGLDCSGLTQWAYGEAGLDLPRLAQEQDVGAAVGRGSVRPGDLAVWDGHVAMVVGDGLMIEAGDPVKLSPIRTTNAGEGFQGFWRPTA